MSFEHLKPGDKVNRSLANAVLMPMTVVAVKDGLIYAAAPGTEDWPLEGLWTFDVKTGAEEDEKLGWGVKFGFTGSFLIATTEEKAP